MSEGITQVIAIVPVSPDGKLKLKKDVRQHLGMKDAQPLFLDIEKESIDERQRLLQGRSISETEDQL